MPKIYLKNIDSKYHRTCFKAENREGKALLKLMKTDKIFPEQLPLIYGLGFDLIINDNQEPRDATPILALKADMVYGNINFKFKCKVGDLLFILINKNFIEIEELPLLIEMGFQFGKISGYIREATRELERRKMGITISKEGELLYERKKQ